jgi:phosphopantetheine--protein transferase-like protein
LPTPNNVNWMGLDIYPARLYAGEMNRCIRRAALWDCVGLDYEVEMPLSAHAVTHTALPLWLVNPLLLAAVGDGFPLWRSRSPFGGASFSVPSRLRSLVLYQAGVAEGARLNCYLRLTGVTPKTHVSDIVVTAGNGNVVAELRGYEELVERVPVEFGRLLLSPVDAYLTRPVATDMLGEPATSVASAMLTDVPYPIFERNEALWLKTVSQIVLHGAERRAFAEMPGATNRRTEWLFGRIAAKEAVRRFLHENYHARWTDADIYIWADESGKPHALGAWQDRLSVRLDLAIAHTAQFVIAVVAANARVGVDVELRSRALSEEFARGVFGPEELELAAHAVDAPAALVRFWCAKEAVSKALGTGIRYPPKELAIEHFLPDVGEMSVTLNGQWLEAFPAFRGRSIRVSSCTVRGHILASCFLPETLFAPEN